MDSNFVPQPPALPITSFTDMASNASTRLNALNSDNMVQCETDDKDVADRIVVQSKVEKIMVRSPVCHMLKHCQLCLVASDVASGQKSVEN